MNTPDVLWILAGSNVACLSLGYLFGRLTRATIRIEERMTEPPVDSQAAVPEPPKASRRRWGALQLITVGVVLIGVMTAAIGVVVTRNQDRLVGCVAGYSNANADALKQSRTAQNVVNDQLDNFMSAVLAAFSTAPADGRAKVQAAVKSYVEAREAAKQVQKDNPLPDAPRDACAELLD